MKISVAILLVAVAGCSTGTPARVCKPEMPALPPEPLIKNLEIIIDEPLEDGVVATGDSLSVKVHVATQPDAEFVFTATLRDVTGLIVSSDKRQSRAQSAEMTLEVPVEEWTYYLEVEVDALEPNGAKTHWSKRITLTGRKPVGFLCPARSFFLVI